MASDFEREKPILDPGSGADIVDDHWRPLVCAGAVGHDPDVRQIAGQAPGNESPGR